MKRPDLVDVAALATSMAACVVAAVVALRFVAEREASPRSSGQPQRIADSLVLADGVERWGTDGADVTLVVFGDFQCPACAELALNTLPALEARFPGRIEVIYRHWPLRQHRDAFPAARAYECARDQGGAKEMHDALYAAQPEIGRVPWREFAANAGVADLERFGHCVADTTPVTAIERDVRVVRGLGGQGTPTVIANGWMLPGGASLPVLDSVVRAVARTRAGP
jgi:protein-disulfide isomerase